MIYLKDIRRLEQDIEELNKKYWDLRNKHERLLAHLGLYEWQVPSKIEFRQIEGLKK